MENYFVIEVVFNEYTEIPSPESKYGVFSSFFKRGQKEYDKSQKVFHKTIYHEKPSELASINPTLWVDRITFSNRKNVWIFDTRFDLWILRSDPGCSLEDFLKDSLGHWTKGPYKMTTSNPYR